MNLNWQIYGKVYIFNLSTTTINPDVFISREVQALATKEKKVSLAHLGHPAPLALQALQQSFQLAAMAQLFPGFPDPEDHQVPQAPKDHQEQRESQLVDCRLSFIWKCQISSYPLIWYLTCDCCGQICWRFIAFFVLSHRVILVRMEKLYVVRTIISGFNSLQLSNVVMWWIVETETFQLLSNMMLSSTKGPEGPPGFPGTPGDPGPKGEKVRCSSYIYKKKIVTKSNKQ